MTLRRPWQRRAEPPDIERRASGFTDSVVAAAVSAASGGGAADPAATAAAEVCASIYGRALSAAEVTPSNVATRAVTAELLNSIGRALVLKGEFCAWVLVDVGAVRLLPAQDWTITGGADPTTWTYRLEMAGPSRSTVRTAAADAVMHVRYATNDEPWKGVSPLVSAGLTSAVLANLERSLAQESATPTGNVVAVPAAGSLAGSDEELDADDNPAGDLARDLQTLKGGVVLTETTQGGFGEGAQAQPARDLRPNRFGPVFSDAEIRLRGEVFDSLLASCGVPPALWTQSDGTAQRESLRRFVHVALSPTAKIVEAGLQVALGEPTLRLDLSPLASADLTGKSRAIKQLVDAGVELAEALEIVGLS